MNKSFGDLLSDSWNEYKLNFKVIFKLFLYFIILPGIVVLLIQTYGTYKLDLFNIDSEENPFAVFVENPGYYISSLALSLIAGFLSFLAYVSITCGALKGKKFSYSEALSEGKKNYWRAIGYIIVVSIFIALLFLLLIIPGVIFAVYWAFAYYVFLGEKKGIMDSLKASKNMVKGKWWMTFGYVLLIMLIIMAISSVFAIPSMILGFIYVIGAIGSGQISSSGFAVIQIVGFVFSIAGQLITTPLMILFMKNFYFAMSKKK
ncbi:MAG: hypothetical protein AABW82_04360 [Nanoarchaeota archaeon]